MSRSLQKSSFILEINCNGNHTHKLYLRISSAFSTSIDIISASFALRQTNIDNEAVGLMVCLLPHMEHNSILSAFIQYTRSSNGWFNAYSFPHTNNYVVFIKPDLFFGFITKVCFHRNWRYGRQTVYQPNRHVSASLITNNQFCYTAFHYCFLM